MSLRQLFVCYKCNTIHDCSQTTPRLPSLEAGFGINHIGQCNSRSR